MKKALAESFKIEGDKNTIRLLQKSNDQYPEYLETLKKLINNVV